MLTTASAAAAGDTRGVITPWCGLTPSDRSKKPQYGEDWTLHIQYFRYVLKAFSDVSEHCVRTLSYDINNYRITYSND